MKKIIEKIKSLDKGTIIRVALLVCAYINQIIALVGMTSFASSPVYQGITVVVTIIVSAITAWKNNDFTHLAQLAGSVLKALKDGKIEENEIQELLAKAKENEEIPEDEANT
jgi:SPP1 family holin